VIRWDIPADPDGPKSKPGKRILPVSLIDGRWANKGMPTRPLYALPELLATPAGSRVWVCEGEKAADAARTLGLVATTSPHGSKSASKADWSPMAGRDVVILPDRDDAGERYADDVTRLALASGALSVRIARLVALWTGMPEGGDLVDLVEHRGGDADAIARKSRRWRIGRSPRQSTTSRKRRLWLGVRFRLKCSPSRSDRLSRTRRRRLVAIRPMSRCPCWPRWRQRSATHAESS